jgi:hypothetical protein
MILTSETNKTRWSPNRLAADAVGDWDSEFGHTAVLHGDRDPEFGHTPLLHGTPDLARGSDQTRRFCSSLVQSSCSFRLLCFPRPHSS